MSPHQHTLSQAGGSPERVSKRREMLGLLLCAFLTPGAAHAEIYRWVDARGGEHFTTDPAQIPADQREAAVAAAAARPTLNRTEAKPAPAPSRTPPPAMARPRPRTTSADTIERISGWSEEEWRERAGALATEIGILERRKEELEELGADHMPLSARRHGTTYRRYAEYRARYREWERAERDLSRARARLERFEERARRAGVPPGWLR